MPRRVVHVRDRRQFRAFEIELIDTEQLLLLFSQGNPQLVAHRRDHQHVRARRALLKIVRDALPKNGRRKRAERLTVFYLEVHHRLHFFAAWVSR